MATIALLVLTYAALLAYVVHGRAALARFKALEDTAARKHYFLRRTALSFTCFALLGTAILAVLGRLSAILVFPTEFAVLRPADAAPVSPERLLGMVIGITLGALTLYAVWRFVLRKKTQPIIGDVTALFPRNYGEAVVLMLPAINAGFSEELFFRLALPLLLTLALGSAKLGFAVAAITFGLMHWYQGWRGVILTGLVALVFQSFYLRSGTIWVPVTIHALIDLLGLVVRPAIGLWLDRRTA